MAMSAVGDGTTARVGCGAGCLVLVLAGCETSSPPSTPTPLPAADLTVTDPKDDQGLFYMAPDQTLLLMMGNASSRDSNVLTSDDHRRCRQRHRPAKRAHRVGAGPALGDPSPHWSVLRHHATKSAGRPAVGTTDQRQPADHRAPADVGPVRGLHSSALPRRSAS